MRRSIFLNYRSTDTRGYAALLHRELSQHFGADLVFLDSESIPPGANYPAELLGHVRQARVVLAVIGADWLTAAGPDGARRLDDPADWIRRELAEAFVAGVRVIPVLTDEAEMPAEADLPAELAPLVHCQFHRLRHRDASADLDRLVKALTKLDADLEAAALRRPAAGMPRHRRLGRPPHVANADAPNRGPRRRSIVAMCTAALLTAAGGITLWQTVPLFTDGKESLAPRTAQPPTATNTLPRTRSTPPPSVPPRSSAPPSTAAPAAIVLSGRYRLYNSATDLCLATTMEKDSQGNVFDGYSEENCDRARILTIAGRPGHYRLVDPVRNGCVAPKPDYLAHDGITIKPVTCDWSPATVVEWDLSGTSTVKMISRTDPTRCVTAKVGRNPDATHGVAFLRMNKCGGDLTALQQWILRKA